MTALHHHTADHLHQLTIALQGYADAGIDPAFDMEMEELERQFAELRLTFNHND
jgi:hypothetical protein